MVAGAYLPLAVVVPRPWARCCYHSALSKLGRRGIRRPHAVKIVEGQKMTEDRNETKEVGA